MVAIPARRREDEKSNIIDVLQHAKSDSEPSVMSATTQVNSVPGGVDCDFCGLHRRFINQYPNKASSIR